MSTIYTLDTTANAPAQGISLKGLGIRNNITHPTVGFNLTDQGLTAFEIQNSYELKEALDNNWIVLYVNGVSITSPEVQPASSQPQQIQNIIANTTPGFLVQNSTGSYTSRSLGAGSPKVQVNNGDGVAGNPTVDIVESNIDLNNISGTLAINKGGTGQTTALGAFNALSPLTAKGSILSHNGSNNVELLVGNNGQILIADSAQSAGLRWARRVDSFNWATNAAVSINRSTSGASPLAMARFIFPGSSIAGVPSAIKIIASCSSTSAFGSLTIRDITNTSGSDNTIASVNSLPQNNNPISIVDMGTISNIPTNPAVFEIQIQRSGGTNNVTVYLASLMIVY
jgi:hypothetical protein